MPEWCSPLSHHLEAHGGTEGRGTRAAPPAGVAGGTFMRRDTPQDDARVGTGPGSGGGQALSTSLPLCISQWPSGSMTLGGGGKGTAQGHSCTPPALSSSLPALSSLLPSAPPSLAPSCPQHPSWPQHPPAPTPRLSLLLC